MIFFIIKYLYYRYQNFVVEKLSKFFYETVWLDLEKYLRIASHIFFAIDIGRFRRID